MHHYSAQELIEKKRDGHRLEDAEIAGFVLGVTRNEITDAQIAAMTMAVWFRDMDIDERTALTLAMRDSGRVLEWEALDGPVLDKHSTGGVGDMVSLVLGPLLAACGAYVPMISGRGLGHTGGTLDKLESIPGFNTSLEVGKLQAQVRGTGVAIVGQTRDLAPADRRIYAVRDITATVSSVPLIVASILSKKLAEGLDGLVMDVKVGSGAFMRELDEARTLARALTEVADHAGLRCSSLITDMNFPLAWAAGNALEVREAVDYLKGSRRHPRLDEVVRQIGAEMLLSGGLEPDRSSAYERIGGCLDSGRAVERFSRMVAGQGGPVDFVDRIDHYLPAAPLTRPVMARSAGFVAAVDTRQMGLAVVDLGGGRKRAEDRIDPSVGLSDLCTAGQEIDPGTPLALLHGRDERQLARAERRVREAVTLSEYPGDVPPMVVERILQAKKT